jgi:transcriptional regulator with XRE-family HTH domain
MEENELFSLVRELLAGHSPRVDGVLDDYTLPEVEAVYQRLHGALGTMGTIDARQRPLEEGLGRGHLYGEISEMLDIYFGRAPTGPVITETGSSASERQSNATMGERDDLFNEWEGRARNQGVDNTSFGGRLMRYLGRKHLTAPEFAGLVGGGITAEDVASLMVVQEAPHLRREQLQLTHYPSAELASRMADVLDLRDTKRERFLNSVPRNTENLTPVDFRNQDFPAYTQAEVELPRWRHLVEKRQAFYQELSEACGATITPDTFYDFADGRHAGLIYGLRPPRNYQGLGIESLVTLAIELELVSRNDEKLIQRLRQAEEAFFEAASSPLDIRQDWNLVTAIHLDYPGTSHDRVEDVAYHVRKNHVDAIRAGLQNPDGTLSPLELEARAEALTDTQYLGGRRYPLKLHGAPTLYASPEAESEIRRQVDELRQRTLPPEGWTSLSNLATKHRISHEVIREYVHDTLSFLKEHYTDDEISQHWVRDLNKHGLGHIITYVSPDMVQRMNYELCLVPSHVKFGQNDGWNVVAFSAGNGIRGTTDRVRERAFAAREMALSQYTEAYREFAEPEVAAMLASHFVDAHLMGYRPTRAGTTSFQFSSTGEDIYRKLSHDIMGSEGWTNDDRRMGNGHVNALPVALSEFQEKLLPLVDQALTELVPNPRIRAVMAKDVVQTQIVGQRYRTLPEGHSLSPSWMIREECLGAFNRDDPPATVEGLLQGKNLPRGLGAMLDSRKEALSAVIPHAAPHNLAGNAPERWTPSEDIALALGDFRKPFVDSLLTRVHGALEQRLSDVFRQKERLPVARASAGHSCAISTIRHNIMQVEMNEDNQLRFKAAPVLMDVLKEADLMSIRADNYRERTAQHMADHIAQKVLESLHLDRDPVRLALVRAKAGEVPFGSGVLKLARELNGHEQSLLFQGMGVSKDVYMRWENDKRPVASPQRRMGHEQYRDYIVDYLKLEGPDRIEAKQLAEGVYLTDVRLQQRKELLSIMREIPAFHGSIIRAVMEDNHHDRTEVARRISVSPRSVESWEKGHKIQQREVAERLADYIGYTGEDKEFFVSGIYHDQRKMTAKEKLAASNIMDDGNKVGV